MKLLTVIILFVLLPVFTMAQVLPDGYDAVTKIQQQVWMDKKLSAANPEYSNVQGTPYILKEFSTGDFYFSNKTFITDKLINYNCYTDEILFSDKKNIYKIQSQDIDYFTIKRSEDGAMLLFKQVFMTAEKKRIFMQVLYQGKAILYKRYRKEFLKADLGQPYGSNRQVDEYNDYYEYYVSVDGHDPVILKPRKSSVTEIFSDMPGIMEAYLRDEKINLKNETDLIKLTEYYDKKATQSQ